MYPKAAGSAARQLIASALGYLESESETRN